MPAKKKSIVSNIKGYDINYELSQGKSISDIISFAKKGAKLANNRLYKLEYADMTNNATTGGVRHIDLKEITDKESASRAISKARSLLVNPLSTPGQVNALYKEAKAKYGSEGRMKFIAVEEKVITKDRAGNEVQRVKLVPKAVPEDTNNESLLWEDVSQALKDYWTWYEKMGQNFLDSDEAYNIWVNSGYDPEKALGAAEDAITSRNEAVRQEYEDSKSTLYGEGRWF